MSNEEILVTIGIPAYNRPETIERAINSVINQTYRNLEILISNDCSPDQQVDSIIKKYSQEDSRIVYLNQKVNIGEMKNSQLLVGKATGKYFMWLADDDFICDNYVESIMHEFSKDSTYSLIGGQSYFVNSDKNSKVKKEVYNLLEEKNTTRFLDYLEMVNSNSIYYGIFERENSLNYNMDFFGSDWLHVARLAYKGKVKTLTETCIYREDSGGASNVEYTYLQKIKIYYGIYKNFKHDIMHSSLYNNLTSEEKKYMIKKSKKFILKHVYISNLLQKIKNRIKRTIY